MNIKALERATKAKAEFDRLPTGSVLDALRKPWHQILGGGARRAAAAQVLGGRPHDHAVVVPALCKALGDSSTHVVGVVAEALYSLMQKTNSPDQHSKAIAEGAAAALQRNLWGMATPMLLQLLARCGAVSAPHIAQIEMSLRYVHLSQPPFIGRLHSLWGNCALVVAGATTGQPLQQIGIIAEQYARRLTHSFADQIAAMSNALGTGAGGLAVASAAFSDTVSDFGFDFALLEAIELLGEKSEPLRPQIEYLSVALTDEKAKQRMQAILSGVDRPTESASAGSQPPTQSDDCVWILAAKSLAYDPVLQVESGGWVPIPLRFGGHGETVLWFTEIDLAREAVQQIPESGGLVVEPWRVPRKNLFRVLALADRLLQQKTGHSLDQAFGNAHFDDTGTLLRYEYVNQKDSWKAS